MQRSCTSPSEMPAQAGVERQGWREGASILTRMAKLKRTVNVSAGEKAEHQECSSELPGGAVVLLGKTNRHHLLLLLHILREPAAAAGHQPPQAFMHSAHDRQ